MSFNVLRMLTFLLLTTEWPCLSFGVVTAHKTASSSMDPCLGPPPPGASCCLPFPDEPGTWVAASPQKVCDFLGHLHNPYFNKPLALRCQREDQCTIKGVILKSTINEVIVENVLIQNSALSIRWNNADTAPSSVTGTNLTFRDSSGAA